MALSLTLRFQSDKQKEAIIKIAKKNNRSLNSELLSLINSKILEERTLNIMNKIKTN